MDVMTTFSPVLVKMIKGKRLRSQTKEVVANVYDYFEELTRHKRTQGSLMPQDFHVQKDNTLLLF